MKIPSCTSNSKTWILRTNHSSMSGESGYVCLTQNWILYRMVSVSFTGHTCEWSYSLHNKVPSPILPNYNKEVISCESLKHGRWIWRCMLDAELNSLSNAICLIHRTYLWVEVLWYNEVPLPLLTDSKKEPISYKSLEHVRWIKVCVSDAELNSLSNGIFLIHRTYLWVKLFPPP